MTENKWPEYKDNFEKDFDDPTILDSPESLACKIDWILDMPVHSKIGQEPRFWAHYFNEVLLDAELVRFIMLREGKRPLPLLDPTNNPIRDLHDLHSWCTNPFGVEKIPKQQRKLQREAKAAYIICKNPNISLAELAKRLTVSQPTASRLSVWREHRKRPPQEQFRDTVDSPHQTKHRP